jgi:hypothetical protein
MSGSDDDDDPIDRVHAMGIMVMERLRLLHWSPANGGGKGICCLATLGFSPRGGVRGT